MFGAAAAILLTATIARAESRRGQAAAKTVCLWLRERHRSLRGLAKGRFSFTRYWFLKDHYASSAESAKALAAYLESVDSQSSKAAAASRSSVRPPAAVPQR
jgi:hypothetical protein